MMSFLEKAPLLTRNRIDSLPLLEINSKMSKKINHTFSKCQPGSRLFHSKKIPSVLESKSDKNRILSPPINKVRLI